MVNFSINTLQILLSVHKSCTYSFIHSSLNYSPISQDYNFIKERRYKGVLIWVLCFFLNNLVMNSIMVNIYGNLEKTNLGQDKLLNGLLKSLRKNE